MYRARRETGVGLGIRFRVGGGFGSEGGDGLVLDLLLTLALDLVGAGRLKVRLVVGWMMTDLENLNDGMRAFS